MIYIIWDTILRRPATHKIYRQVAWADRLARRMNDSVERPVLWPFRFVALEMELARWNTL
jgi:hypothetical protein